MVEEEQEDKFQFSISYRPQSVKEWIGAETTKQQVDKVIRGRTQKAAVLLTGPTGSGKTTLAKIIAYEINGIPYDTNTPDIHYHDGGVKTGVDDIRALAHYYNRVPQYKKNVIIVDEIQKLSQSALSALLTPLEAPRKNRIFLLCTNEPERLLDTIVGRCYPINIEAPDPKEFADYLQGILKKEKAFPKAKDKELKKLARAVVEGGGGLPRQCLQLLEAAVDAGEDYDSIKKLIKSPVLRTPTAEMDKAAVKILLAMQMIYDLAGTKGSDAEIQKKLAVAVSSIEGLDCFPVINRLTNLVGATTRELLTGNNVPAAWPLKKAAQVFKLNMTIQPFLIMLPKIVHLKDRLGAFQVDASLLLLATMIELVNDFEKAKA